MTVFQNTIDLLGDEVTARKIVDGTIGEYNDNVINSVGYSAFSGCNNLRSVNMPNVTSTGSNAFSLCTSLVSVELPNATSIKGGSFGGCTFLERINLPNATTLNGNTFSNCTSLKSVDLPKVTNASYGEFSGCSALVSVNLPALMSGESGLFEKCTSLESIDLPVRVIDETMFKSCAKLNVLILRIDTRVCRLSNVNAFDGTPFAVGGTGGTVYVPQALIGQYQTETNWSTLYAAGTCNFVAIEGSEYE